MWKIIFYCNYDYISNYTTIYLIDIFFKSLTYLLGIEKRDLKIPTCGIENLRFKN